MRHDPSANCMPRKDVPIAVDRGPGSVCAARVSSSTFLESGEGSWSSHPQREARRLGRGGRFFQPVQQFLCRFSRLGVLQVAQIMRGLSVHIPTPFEQFPKAIRAQLLPGHFCHVRLQSPGCPEGKSIPQLSRVLLNHLTQQVTVHLICIGRTTTLGTVLQSGYPFGNPAFVPVIDADQLHPTHLRNTRRRMAQMQSLDGYGTLSNFWLWRII